MKPLRLLLVAAVLTAACDTPAPVSPPARPGSAPALTLKPDSTLRLDPEEGPAPCYTGCGEGFPQLGTGTGK